MKIVSKYIEKKVIIKSKQTKKGIVLYFLKKMGFVYLKKYCIVFFEKNGVRISKKIVLYCILGKMGFVYRKKEMHL